MTIEDGVLARLRAHHEHLIDLIASAESAFASNDSPEVRREAYRKLRAEILAHIVAEQKATYEPLQSFEETRAIASQCEGQDEFIEEDLVALDRMSPASADWLERFALLKERVQEHVDDVEAGLLEVAVEVLTPAELRELDEEFSTVKEEKLDELLEAENGAGSPRRPERTQAARSDRAG